MAVSFPFFYDAFLLGSSRPFSPDTSTGVVNKFHPQLTDPAGGHPEEGSFVP